MRTPKEQPAAEAPKRERKPFQIGEQLTPSKPEGGTYSVRAVTIHRRIGEDVRNPTVTKTSIITGIESVPLAEEIARVCAAHYGATYTELPAALEAE